LIDCKQADGSWKCFERAWDRERYEVVAEAVPGKDSLRFKYAFIGVLNDGTEKGTIFGKVTDDEGRTIWSASASLEPGLVLINETEVLFDMPNREYKVTLTAGHGTTADEKLTLSVVPTEAPSNPDLKIENLQCPESAEVGSKFTVSWFVHNAGASGGAQWTRLIDAVSGKELWKTSLSLKNCERAGPIAVELTMPAKELILRVEAGYDSTITDSKEADTEAEVPAAEILLGIILSVLGALGIYKLIRR
jgi:hypothetical protein